jgi:hypothetical protein
MPDWLSREDLLALGAEAAVVDEALRLYGVAGNDGRLCLSADDAEDRLEMARRELQSRADRGDEAP